MSCFDNFDIDQFLDAPSHLYKRLCPSVGPSVRPSVRPSARLSRVIFRRLLGASCAVYPALFFFLIIWFPNFLLFFFFSFSVQLPQHPQLPPSCSFLFPFYLPSSNPHSPPAPAPFPLWAYPAVRSH